MLEDAATAIGRERVAVDTLERHRSFRKTKDAAVADLVDRGMLHSGMAIGRISDLLRDEIKARVEFATEVYLGLLASGDATDESTAEQIKSLVAGDIADGIADLASVHKWLETLMGPGVPVPALQDSVSDALRFAAVEIDSRLYGMSHAAPEAPAPDVFSLKPTWMGIGVDLKALYRRLVRK